uniref:Uncharacterized protein n=1 Tax=Globodera rostochiensis TaxID=31243 RepID=A0A914HGK2_GLORO
MLVLVNSLMIPCMMAFDDLEAEFGTNGLDTNGTKADGTKADNTASSSAWIIWTSIGIGLILLALLVIACFWKWRQSRAPSIVVTRAGDVTTEMEMSEMPAAPTRRWAPYDGAWDVATGCFKGGKALF